MKKIKLCLSVYLLFFLCTTINAQTWWPQTSTTTVKLYNINFFDNNLGYAFGDTLSTMVKTTNSGAIWTGLSPAFTNADLRSSSFLNSNTVVAVGIHDVVGGKGVVMKTSNGGVSWSADTSIAEQLFDVSFANSTDGWISGENGYIARTTNGGTNWLQLTTGTGEDIFSVYFVNANEGWAVGTVNVNAVILHTTNAGTNWTPQNSGLLSQLSSVFFINNSTGWAVGAGGNIIATTDSGTTWTPQTSGITNDLFDVYFLDTNKGWAVGGAGTVLKTTNGGINWTLETSGTTTDINSITMRNDSLGWFCGDGGEIRVYAMNPPLAINEIDKWNIDIEVYPNPSNEWLRIDLKNYNKDWSFALYDITGRLVLDKNQINENSIVIKKNRITSGQYLLKVVNTQGQIHTEKIIFE